MTMHHATHNQNLKKKDMDFTFTRNFKVHLLSDRDEIMPWYYVMILRVTFGPCDNLLKDHMV